MKIKKLLGKTPNIDGRGFSLIELLIVVAILGILAISVGVHINTAKTKLKSFVFNTKTRFNQAKFEAIKRSRPVYLEFHLNMDDVGYVATANPDNGYTIWVDNDDDQNYDFWDIGGGDDTNGNGTCDAGEGDCVIAIVDFDQLAGGRYGPEIYNGGAAFPSGGPENDGPGTRTIGNGVEIDDNVNYRFRFKPNGDSEGGEVYFYFPQGDVGAKEVKSGPWAIIVNTVGRVRIDEWKSAGYGWEVNT